MAFLKTKDLKNYTVQGLRGEVRSLIKEANKIIYELDKSKKSGYMTKIAQDIAESGHISTSKSGEVFTQSKVKYMRKGQLQTLYNELTAFIQADKESPSYAKKLSGRRDTMRKKTAASMGKKISKKQYQTMLDLWDEFEDEMEAYGYTEMLDVIKSKEGKVKSAKNLIDELSESEARITELTGVKPGSQTVLLYYKNKDAIEKIMKEEGLSLKEAIEKISTY